MVRSAAATVEEYLAELDPDRRKDISAVRDVVLANASTSVDELIAEYEATR